MVIRINSPGGVVAPTQELHTALQRVREAGKPVVASLGAVAASGGYYVAVAADRIYANPGTLTGSIGVIMQLANLEGLFKKVGVDWVVVKAGQLKDIGNIARPMTPEERRVLQVLLDDVHGQFIAAVAGAASSTARGSSRSPTGGSSRARRPRPCAWSMSWAASRRRSTGRRCSRAFRRLRASSGRGASSRSWTWFEIDSISDNASGAPAGAVGVQDAPLPDGLRVALGAKRSSVVQG